MGSGNAITANTIFGRSTFMGDFDFNSMVTPDDYAVIDANLGSSPAPGIAWLCGDGDFNGQVTADDYTAVDANLGRRENTPPVVSITSPGGNPVNQELHR